MDHLRHKKYKSEHTEMEHLNNIWKNRILKVKKSLLEFEDFGEVNDKEIKIRKYIQELFTKPINMSVKDMDKFEEKEMKTVCKKDLV